MRRGRADRAQARVAEIFLAHFASGISIENLTHPVTVGVVSGLLIGKPLGILVFVGLAVAFRFVQLPNNVNWIQLLGVAFACGIGFTMSLFIAGLAFEHGSGDYFSGDRLGILVGSILSALAAYILLHVSLPKSIRSDLRSARGR